MFMHGLGLGLTQYKMFLSHLLRAVKDRPVLIPLQPHVSQEIFHPQYLQPMNRHASAAALAGLLKKLGWVRGKDEEADTPGAGKTDGVTVISHSKCVLYKPAILSNLD